MIEIISIHIPKTGGSSLLRSLQENYGEECVLHYNRDNTKTIRYNKRILNSLINNKIKVIHGHLFYRDVKHLIKNDTKIITWLREPISRVISNYWWFQHTVISGNNNLNKHRVEEPLDEYLKDKVTRNKIYKFLKGADCEKFFFIGQIEFYKRDFQELSERLNWSKLTIFTEKRNKDLMVNPKPFTEAEIEKINKANKKDLKIYKALQSKISQL